MKIYQIEGDAIDWAVAQCENRKGQYWMNDSVWGNYSPSTRWAIAGPIIEREEISIAKVGATDRDSMAQHPECWCAHKDGSYSHYGATPLIAAMRCYVAVKLGYDIDVPPELLKPLKKMKP